MPNKSAITTVVEVPIAACCAANITPTQYTFLYLLHTKNLKALEAYVQANRGFPRHEVKDLNDRGFLLYFNVVPEVETAADNMYVTEKFTDLIYSEQGNMVDDDTSFNELFALYPTYIEIDGRKMSARSLDTDLYCDYYAAIIKGKREEHQRILEDVQYAKDHNLLNMGLERFLKSRQWLTIRQEREANDGNVGFNRDI